MRRVHYNPAVDVRAPKRPKRLPRTLDADQMARVLEKPPATAEGADQRLAIRDLAIMELLYSSGLRLAELVGLDLHALDLADRTVRVTGKGSKKRIVPVGSQAITALQRWLSVRAGLAQARRNRGVRRPERPPAGSARRAAAAGRHRRGARACP